jgi:lipoate-protein ligase A
MCGKFRPLAKCSLILFEQDLGNTNYCVFMPRTQFERRTNALLVSDALNNLDINTYVNDRNDICIDGYKISCTSGLRSTR